MLKESVVFTSVMLLVLLGSGCATGGLTGFWVRSYEFDGEKLVLVPTEDTDVDSHFRTVFPYRVRVLVKNVTVDIREGDVGTLAAVLYTQDWLKNVTVNSVRITVASTQEKDAWIRCLTEVKTKYYGPRHVAPIECAPKTEAEANPRLVPYPGLKK